MKIDHNIELLLSDTSNRPKEIFELWAFLVDNDPIQVLVSHYKLPVGFFDHKGNIGSREILS